MSPKHLNLGSAQPIQKGWVPETRFINYEYGPLRVHAPALPQEQSKKSDAQPLRGGALGLKEKAKPLGKGQR
jgi:hypothetical protein